MVDEQAHGSDEYLGMLALGIIGLGVIRIDAHLYSLDQPLFVQIDMSMRSRLMRLRYIMLDDSE